MAKQVLINGKPTNGINPYIDSLVFGGAWEIPSSGPVLIKYLFAEQGEEFVGKPWGVDAINAVRSVQMAWEAVANIDFQATTDLADADVNYLQTHKGSFSKGVIGRHDIPGFNEGEPLEGWFNVDHPSWSEKGLRQGGYGYRTILHELGHSLGLAHPFDGGSADDATRFPGVPRGGKNSLGTYDMSQGIWTTMSYNAGWNSVFGAKKVEFGNEATPMALDIAAVQAIYGAAPNHTGNDEYVLPDANRSGAFWSCIWDTGGDADTISAAFANSLQDALLFLEEAPLEGPHAGGYVSRIKGIRGGFTIANGVTIENAVGGDGNDHIRGNSAANDLFGGNGNDFIEGGEGDDTLTGSKGRDRIDGGQGFDTFVLDGKENDFRITELGQWTKIENRKTGEYDLAKNIELIQYEKQNDLNNTFVDHVQNRYVQYVEEVSVRDVFEKGIRIEGQTYKSVFVGGSDGYVSFGEGLHTGLHHNEFQTFDTPNISPYWGDADDDDGRITYGVNRARDSFVVTWYNVHPGNLYSEDEDPLWSYQLELMDRGNGKMRIVFRYPGTDWTGGDDYRDDNDDEHPDLAPHAGFEFDDEVELSRDETGQDDNHPGVFWWDVG